MSKEELDPYEKEVKRAIEEYDKGLNKKDPYESELKKAEEEAEEDEGGFFDEGSAFRTTAAIGTEIAANTLLDLFSFIPPAQYAGGAAINYLAQRIRGGEFSEGEMIASGLASLLPGGAQAKSLGGVIGKGVARGALSGAIETGAADLIDTGELDAERIGTGALVGGAFGGIFSYGASQKGVQRGIKYFQDRIKGEKFVKLSPEDALELGLGEPMMSVRKGGFSDEAERRIAQIQDQLNIERGKQLGLFTNEGDAFLYAKYKAQNKVLGTPLPRRQQAGRALRPTDFDDIIEEYPEITPDLIFAYIESTKAGRFGKGERNPVTKRFRRNNRGLEGTIRFLNQKAAPNPDFDLSEIAAELSAEFNKTITPKTLSNIIDENVDKGTFTFKTQGMSEAVEIKNIDDLRRVYMARVARYSNIPAFERGHVFAADNIIKDNKVKNLTDFKNNLEPEIARSIYAQLDNEALEELIQANVDNNFEDIESLYKSIIAGNRSRRNLADPDKIIAELYGRDYGLRESFLNFVFPDRSLGRLIPADLKAAFTDLYQKELKEALANYQGLTIGPNALDIIRTRVAKDVLKSFPDVDSRFVIEQMTIASDKGFAKDMVDPLTGEAK